MGFSFSPKLDLGCYIVSIPKTISKKLEPSIVLLTEVVLYPYISTILPSKGPCCHAWASNLKCYMDTPDKLQRQVYETVGHMLFTLLDPWDIIIRVQVVSIGIAVIDVYMNCQNWSYLFLSVTITIWYKDMHVHNYFHCIPRVYY